MTDAGFGCAKNVYRRDVSVIGLREESIRDWTRTSGGFGCLEEIRRQRKERLSGGRWRCRREGETDRKKGVAFYGTIR